MTAEILYGDIRLKAASGDLDTIDRNLRCLRLQMIDSSRCRCLELFRQGPHAEICAIAVQNALYEEVSTDKNMAGHSLTEFAHGVCDTNHVFDNRHVTVLAALLVLEIAGEPFLIRHLFRQFADLLSTGA